MLKRVNIQYSIDLEELPAEVDRIYNNARGIFKDLSLPEEAGEKLLTADVLKKLDNARKQLTYLDHILSDVTGIVGSYVEYELSARRADQQVPPEDPLNAENTIKMP